MKLTKRIIDNVTYAGNAQSRDVRWDLSIPGLGLRIYPSGRKSFVLSYRIAGRKRLMTLGNYGTLTLEQARKLAKKHLVEIIDQKDPLQQKQSAAHTKTIKALCETYMERHATVHKKSWKDDERRINKYILPKWANLKVNSIKRADVAALHSKIGIKHKYEANRLLVLLSKIFQLAKRWGVLPEESYNPAREIDHFKEIKRDRWVTPEELPKLAEAIDKEKNLQARYAIWLYLLIGARKSELLKAKWDDIDWGRKELRLPITKSGKTHYLPLSTAALEVIKKIPILENNPYIFTGNKEGKHLVNIDKAWRRIRKHAQIEDVRLHDLRRTVGSWLAQSGNSLHLIGRILNHSNTATTAIYARFGQDTLREALENHGKKLMGIADKKEGAEIISICK